MMQWNRHWALRRSFALVALGLVLLGCKEEAGGGSDAGAAPTSSGAANPVLRRCVTSVGCFEYTGSKLQSDESAAKRSCDTVEGAKLELGSCSRDGVMGTCTRNVGEPEEYLVFVPLPPGAERSVAAFKAMEECQQGDDLGIWSDIYQPAPASSPSK